MFRSKRDDLKVVKDTDNDITSYEQLEARQKKNREDVAAGIFSPVKKRILAVILDFQDARVAKQKALMHGASLITLFVNTSKIVQNITTMEAENAILQPLFNASILFDDPYLIEIRRLARLLPADSVLRSDLLSAAALAEQELTSRRSNLHFTAGIIAVGATLAAIYADPTLGLCATALELVAIATLDIPKALNNYLEKGDNTAVTKVNVNGHKEEQPRTTYHNLKMAM